MKAIYTVIENGRESYFGTNIADGFSYPFVIFSYAERMAKALNENNPMGTVGAAEMLPLMKANKYFPENTWGERIFCPISEIVFFERESEMSQNAYTSFSITLNFDQRKIGFVFNQNNPELPMPRIEISLDQRDALNTFGKINPLISAESFYRTELESSVMECPVFAIKIHSDKIPEMGSVILPLSFHNQKVLAKELETDNLDKCEILAVTAFDKTLADYLAIDLPQFSRLNKLANELNKMRLDCGDNAFNSFVRANKATPFRDTEGALAAVEEIRKDFYLQENQGMELSQ